MPQNWLEMNGVKMDLLVADFLAKRGFLIVFDEDDGEDHGVKKSVMAKKKSKKALYPWAAYIPLICRSCGRSSCSCLRPPLRHQALHLLAWDLMRGSTRPRRRGEVVHHQYGDKKDARIKRLGIGTRKEHGLAHMLRRQKFSKRKRDHLGDFNYSPRQPARVITRTELIGTTVPLPPKRSRPLSKGELVQEVETRLGLLFDDLAAEMAPLDSGAPMPKSAPPEAWWSPKSRIHRIKMPKLEPSPGEAAFVMELVKNQHDLDAVAAETGENIDILRAFYELPAVSEALRHWRVFKRLPLVAG